MIAKMAMYVVDFLDTILTLSKCLHIEVYCRIYNYMPLERITGSVFPH